MSFYEEIYNLFSSGIHKSLFPSGLMFDKHIIVRNN